MNDKEVEDFFRNYQDRGMLKWAGFYLSDHTLKIQQDEKKRKQVFEKRSEMNFQEISQLLMQAYAKQIPVSIQLRKLDSELKYQADVAGYILGFSAAAVIIEGRDGKKQSVVLTEINNVLIE